MEVRQPASDDTNASAASCSWLHAFPGLANLDEHERRQLQAAARPTVLARGALVFEAGQDCQQYLLIRARTVRVHLLDPDGHEIVLYRLHPGDTCILTAAALLGKTRHPAYAVVEEPTEAIALPAAAFDTLLARPAAFRGFVFAFHAERIADLMRVVSNVAFTRIDVRLARCLLERAEPSGQVTLTHDAIATEIGTAREVVSPQPEGTGAARLRTARPLRPVPGRPLLPRPGRERCGPVTRCIRRQHARADALLPPRWSAPRSSLRMPGSRQQGYCW